MKELLNKRMKNEGRSSKMAMMAEQSANGKLTSFSGIFHAGELTEHEKSYLEAILNQYSSNQDNVEKDLLALISLTSEVKAINNQAALLHGERIKRAQSILKQYKDGAFTAWLIAAYGNRQTPYNFLQYYEFFEALPKHLRARIELMPRQAIYTLASREGTQAKKEEIIQSYKGETKVELLRRIRDTFPLSLKDRRRQNFGENAIQLLTRLQDLIENRSQTITKSQKMAITQLLRVISAKIEA